jgi:hypothetical protein
MAIDPNSGDALNDLLDAWERAHAGVFGETWRLELRSLVDAQVAERTEHLDRALRKAQQDRHEAEDDVRRTKAKLSGYGSRTTRAEARAFEMERALREAGFTVSGTREALRECGTCAFGPDGRGTRGANVCQVTGAAFPESRTCGRWMWRGAFRRGDPLVRVTRPGGE